MQRGRGGRDAFYDFGDPFGGFGRFGGFGGPRNLMSGVFGGRDPFDDPFFRDPFGSMFGTGFFPPGGPPFPHMNTTSFIEDRRPEPKRSRGPIIEEINADEEKEEQDEQREDNRRKHRRASKEPYVEDAEEEEAEHERKDQLVQYRSNYSGPSEALDQPQTHCFTYQSSTVTYGGVNGAYYTSSKTRRTGSDGITFEESKEADTATRQASHRVSRGIHSKGHSVTRKLNSDGRVDTMQALHNLDEDELPSFEERWTSKAGKRLPGLLGNSAGYPTSGAGGSEQPAGQGSWFLPSIELQQPDTVTARGRERPRPSYVPAPGGRKVSSSAGGRGNLRQA